VRQGERKIEDKLMEKFYNQKMRLEYMRRQRAEEEVADL
jgi:hypothetical protein